MGSSKTTVKKKKRKQKRIKLNRFLPTIILLLAVVGVGGWYLTSYFEKQSYSLAYVEEIKLCSAEYLLDPYLVAAIIHVESGGDPEAVSHAGAVGLMQIMPKTGEWIAEKLELNDYSEEQLYLPSTNIRMGCWYMNYLIEKYGVLDHALAAYNAGPGNVDKWLDNSEYSENGRLVNIPFEETANYLVKVHSAYDAYVEHYEKELD